MEVRSRDSAWLIYKREKYHNISLRENNFPNALAEMIK